VSRNSDGSYAVTTDNAARLPGRIRWANGQRDDVTTWGLPRVEQRELYDVGIPTQLGSHGSDRVSEFRKHDDAGIGQRVMRGCAGRV